MARTVTFPFSVLNALPGVSGVDDVEVTFITLPDLQEQNEDIQEDIRAAEDRLRTDLVDRIQIEAGETREAIEDLEVNGDPEGPGLTIDVNGIFGPLKEDLQAALRLLVEDVEEDLEDLEAGQDEILAALGVEDAPDDPPETDDTQTGGGGGGVPGDDLAGDVASGAGDLLGEGADTVGDAVNANVPSLDEIASVVSEAVLGALRDLPGFDLLEDPEAFIDAQIDRLTSGLVSPGKVEALEAEVDEVFDVGGEG